MNLPSHIISGTRPSILLKHALPNRPLLPTLCIHSPTTMSSSSQPTGSGMPSYPSFSIPPHSLPLACLDFHEGYIRPCTSRQRERSFIIPLELQVPPLPIRRFLSLLVTRCGCRASSAARVNEKYILTLSSASACRHDRYAF